MLVSISRAAQALGVTQQTLRQWEAEGMIAVVRTPKGHRRYNLEELRSVAVRSNPARKVTLSYAKLKSHDPKENLSRQIALLESFCASNGWQLEEVLCVLTPSPAQDVKPGVVVQEINELSSITIQ